ncbi:uncharacterized protein LOC132557192 [Ylistrum balloti]|uniref:uncharacterized protein LOC132557192 n=1 Tax=Ylistrum balloti TaxID=509963 RepID=UPI002905C907|nr:uncharacterized protein LOC132557192 [Ylistrum balloti]
MKFSVLIVFVITWSTSQTQDISCVPQEISSYSLNCSSINSVYLSCACNVYKTSILEIMGTLSCLLPTVSATSEIQSQVNQLLDMVTEDPTAVIKSVIENQIIPLAGLNTLASPAALVDPSKGSSLETVSMILNITERIGEDVFNKMCTNVDQLSQCVNSNFMSSVTPDDLTLKAIFNLDQVGTFLTSMCAMKSDLYGQTSCLSNIILPLGICAYLPNIWNQSPPEFPLLSGKAISDVQFSYYCPVAGDFLQCAAIQMDTCSSNLGTIIKTLTSNLLTTSCSNLALEGTQYPTASPFLFCGIPHVSKAFPIISTIEGITSTPTTSQIQAIAERVISLGCDILPDYFTCVVEELPSSKSRYDLFIQELIDVKQLTYGRAIANLMCQKDRITAISNMLPCIMTKANEIEACFTANRTAVFDSFNITNLVHDANNDRQQFCGPIKDIAMCFIDNALVPCDSNVGDFARETYHWLMQTECYGARNGSYQQVIDLQSSGSPVAFNNARISWIGVLLLSIILYLS